MIRIYKPKEIPQRLLVEGKKKRRSHCSSYSRNPDSYQSNAKGFGFDRTIYAHETVKQALMIAQVNKCCFCERIVGLDGDVEHFRPKKAVKQAMGEALQYPGYYWLAYEWDNLYLDCSGCNQRHKQNLFPLQNPADRATHPTHNIDREQPLFIDPGQDDPEQLIGFRAEIPYAINRNPKGQTTIDTLKLKERSLPEARLQRLQMLKGLHRIVLLAAEQPTNTKLQNEAKAAVAVLKQAGQNSAEFASAARCAMQTNFQFVLN